MSDTRLDTRSLKEFKKDIKESSDHQSIIIDRWLHAIGKSHLKYWDRGTDNTGKYQELNKVTTYPDYEVESIGLIEVQYSNSVCQDYFHIKEKKLLECLRLNAKMLMVNGFKTDNPLYTLISVSQMNVIQGRCDVTSWAGGGFNNAYKIPLKWFAWNKL